MSRNLAAILSMSSLAVHGISGRSQSDAWRMDHRDYGCCVLDIVFCNKSLLDI